MSDPRNQRADGCSVFFTFIMLALLLAGFYLAQRVFEPDQPEPVTEVVDSARRLKAQAYREQNDRFTSNVDQFHADRNSSLESSMNHILKKYRASPRANQNQSN